MATLGILCQLNIITVSTQKVMNDIQIYCIAEDRLPSPLAVWSVHSGKDEPSFQVS